MRSCFAGCAVLDAVWSRVLQAVVVAYRGVSRTGSQGRITWKRASAGREACVRQEQNAKVVWRREGGETRGVGRGEAGGESGIGERVAVEQRPYKCSLTRVAQRRPRMPGCQGGAVVRSLPLLGASRRDLSSAPQHLRHRVRLFPRSAEQSTQSLGSIAVGTL